MASSTITETIEQFYETSKSIQLTQHYHETKKTATNDSKNQKITPYDEALGRCKESKFMKPIRDWERRVGFVTPILWVNTIAIITLHLVTTLWFLIDFSCFVFPKWQTIAFAKWPLQLILLACYSVAGQVGHLLHSTIVFLEISPYISNKHVTDTKRRFEVQKTSFEKDHRVHHKYSERTADPHDANRGFFFAHVGWLMMKKHPDTASMSVLSQAFLRYMMSLNFTWSVNSFAHLWGNKPYDRHIMPSENIAVSIVAMGEGWHNYHHTFPWDYKAAELGMSFNLTTVLLDLFARIGWAYDLKVASPALVKEVANNRGGTVIKEREN
ncbi:Acyl-CoA Delta(11) desaturase [Operophtera brumata]|uniref:Acyl-CoA Delta(11) desaturase n=1 Tax=Operophtera brumata TaxID=104452 RepID=A0A0L7L2A2_OPEBR|nr:Acyl-CoA Delta(11) desaturase [Operophtera brumata]